MCGIVGVFRAGAPETGTTLVHRMNDTIVHRGPDDDGHWAMQDAAVAMRRLSIIDLAGGHQPMVTDDGVAIVFNGEIYNYRALREELRAYGYVFRTTSDTEVVLNLYHHAGLRGLEKLEGMFGICLVDPRRGEAYLIRDRLGIKPLYYGEEDGRFYFASEIKAILAGMSARPEPNPHAFFDYLTLRYVPAPETVWRGIRKLEPGQRLTYRFADGTWKIETYWRLNFASAAVESGRDYEGEFEKLFLGAVESHLVASDVPVGTLLSGGLDSSAVTAAAIELGIRGFHTFSVAFEDGGAFSELAYARKVAEHVGSNHHEVVIGQKQFVDFLHDFVWFADEPLADLASIPLYYVSRLAREHVKVVLSGEGADEILGGYDFEQIGRTADRRRALLSWVPRSAYKMASWFFNGQRAATLRAMAQDGWSGYLKAWLFNPSYYWNDTEKRSIWRHRQGFPSTDDVIRSWYDMCRSDAPLDKVQQVSCHSWLVEDLLMKADKMTMANSLELRVPYLDHRLVEWAQALPLSMKVGDRRSGYVSKRILREFARKRLPASIIDRPKQGFPVPAYEWLKGDLGRWARDLLGNLKSPLREWLDLSGIHVQFDAAQRGNTSAAHKVWSLVILGMWADRWL